MPNVKSLLFVESLVDHICDAIIEDMAIVVTSIEYADVRILPSNIENKKRLSLKAGELAEVMALKLLNEGSLVCELLSPVN